MQGRTRPSPLPSQLSDSSRTVFGNNELISSKKRMYQVWKGSNRFFLGGRLIFGPDVRSFVFTVFLIVVPIILFGVFVSPNLVKDFNHHLGYLIVAIAIIFALYDLVLLFLTSCRDPGIIPRSAHPPQPEDNRRSSSVSADWAGHCGPSSLPPTKNVLVNGFVVKVKYCHTCMLYRPPRSSHCSICNNCVERFDHHCPWVGQCIGKRNYRTFFMFVFSTALLCLYVFAFCWVNLTKIMVADVCNLWGAIQRSPVSWALIIYTFVAAWFAGGLTVFHLYLVCSNQTTYENFRYRYDGKFNPYNQGCGTNITEILFSPIPKSKNNFRDIVTEYSSVFRSSLPRGYAMSPDFRKSSFDLEMGGNRLALAEEEHVSVHGQIENVQRLERCRTRPPHLSWGSSQKSWEITPDIEMLAAEFGMEHGFGDRERRSSIGEYYQSSGEDGC